MTIIGYVALFIAGIVAGIIGGLLGTGGCVIMLPMARFGFGFSPAMAVGTTITAVIFTATSGAIKHFRLGNVDTKTVPWVASFGVIGVILGSLVFSYLLPYGSLIDLIVGLAFIVLALRMLYEGFFLKEMPSGEGSQVPGRKSGKGLLGTVIGFLTGIIGLGGGYALVPSFIYFFKAPVKIAIGTSMASFISMAVVGSGFKIYQGVVDIPAGVVMGAGAAIGAIFGAGLVAKIKASTLKALFGILFLYVSLKYIFRYFGMHI
ncbi:MAG: sulfite exporter TauE/SafE family protein [Thermodesulfobacteriota bacterium]